MSKIYILLYKKLKFSEKQIRDLLFAENLQMIIMAL